MRYASKTGSGNGCKPRKLANFANYYHFVRFNRDGQSEWEELLESILNHETSFFRHRPSFDVLREFVLPRLVEKKRGGHERELSLWSTGAPMGPRRIHWQ